MTRIDADYATLGGLLLDPAQLEVIEAWLRPQDFTRPLCGELYELIGRMRSAGQPVDPVTVLGELRRGGRVRSDGYPAMELIAMIETVPAPVMTPHYARQVLEEAVFRKVEAVGTRIVQVGRSRRGVPDDAFDSVASCWAELVEVRERWRRCTSDKGVPGAELVAVRVPMRDVAARARD